MAMVDCIVLCLFYVTFRYARLDTSIVLTLHYTLHYTEHAGMATQYIYQQTLKILSNIRLFDLSFYPLFSIKVTMLGPGGQSGMIDHYLIIPECIGDTKPDQHIRL